MAGPKRFNKDKRPKRALQSLLFAKRFCRFTAAGVEEIDYKDTFRTPRDFCF
jgi:small subunit ribosomal protein S18